MDNEPGLLVHEGVHVWQYQHTGAGYSVRALWAQQTLPSAHNWQAEIDCGNDQWVDLNPESQAQFLQRVFIDGELIVNGGMPTAGNGARYDAEPPDRVGRFIVDALDHSDRANAGVAALRGESSYRLSNLIT